MSEAPYNPLLGPMENASGDSIFNCLTGTIVRAEFAPFANYGTKKIDGFFFLLDVLPDPGEKCVEHLGKHGGLVKKIYSGGSYNTTKVGKTPTEPVDLSLPEEQQYGEYAIHQGGRTGFVANSKFGEFMKRVFGLIESGDLDVSRFSDGSITKALVGVRAHFVGVDPPKWERKSKKKGAVDVFGGTKKSEEEKEPEQIMVLDTIEGYLSAEEIEKLKATAGSMATGSAATAAPEHVAAMEALVLGLLAEKGSVELSDIAPMVVKAVQDESNTEVTQANRAEIMKLGNPSWMFSDDRPWVSEGKKVTAAK